MLRYQPTIGPAHATQITRYLSLPVVPTYLGFDPRMQLIHESDALGALVAAVKRPVRGAVNVAAPGTVGLTRMIRLAGRPTLPVPGPLFGTTTQLGRRFGLFSFSPDFRRLLRYGRGVDTTRLIEEIGYTPTYSTVAAIRDYADAPEAAAA
jgi:UDP-glucose 4-epimerase